ncbi:hypothetical protein [Scytonema sp. NUACC26]|uniref:hypothetical protein n=1 Tax=Scytonema sp. NUACC26 TaxID=3140176 RepID=UPI0034DB9469
MAASSVRTILYTECNEEITGVMTEQFQETEKLERKMTVLDVEVKFEPIKQGRSLVVVIGINEYVHWQKLKNAVQDAIGLQQTLIDKLRFSENNFERVIEIIDTLLALNPSKGLIPLSQSDLWDIREQLYCWTDVLAIPETNFALKVTVLVRDANGTPDRLEAAKEIKLGDRNGYLIEHRKIFRLSIHNSTESPMHIYMIKIDSNGCFKPVIHTVER